MLSNTGITFQVGRPHQFYFHINFECLSHCKCLFKLYGLQFSGLYVNKFVYMWLEIWYLELYTGVLLIIR